MAGELFTEEDMQQLPYSKHIVLKGNGYTYFTLVPSDVQNSPDEKLSKEYEAMSEQLADVRKSIRLSPVNSPFPVINISLQELNTDNLQSVNYNPLYSLGNELKGLTFDLNDTNQKNSIMKCLDLIERKAWVDNSND